MAGGDPAAGSASVHVCVLACSRPELAPTVTFTLSDVVGMLRLTGMTPVVIACLFSPPGSCWRRWRFTSRLGTTRRRSPRSVVHLGVFAAVSTWPGCAPVSSPLRITTTPFTST